MSKTLKAIQPKSKTPLTVSVRHPAPAAKSLKDRRPCVIPSKKDRIRNRNSKQARRDLREHMES